MAVLNNFFLSKTLKNDGGSVGANNDDDDDDGIKLSCKRFTLLIVLRDLNDMKILKNYIVHKIKFYMK